MAAKLGEHAQDLRPERYRVSYGDELPLAAYCELLTIAKRGSRSQQQDIRERQGELLLELHCHLGRIWRLVAPDPTDETALDQNFAWGMAIAIQRYRDHYVTSETWRRELAAIDCSDYRPSDHWRSDRWRSDRWLALAAEHEAAGHLFRTNAALAAARWLDPGPRTATAAAEITRGRCAAPVPPRLRDQPKPGFRDAKLHDRHWRAWEMKEVVLDVPSLIAYACDENFWVRARIYRSLGQQPMIAAVPVLVEGLLDPHPFARAQAARSLGWIGAPVALDSLHQLAGDDPSADVRRAARQAAERIVGYWLFYGEHEAIAARSPRGRFEWLRQLAAHDLGGLADELLSWDPDAGIPRPDHDALANDLRPFSLAPRPGHPYHEYSSYFCEAEAFEADVARTDPEREPDDMLALYAVSKHGRCAARAADLATAPGAIGWNARRALRALRLPA
ncbi:MAG TPA: HEAT repeat domain-containing protein [Kofleriaceae bacterium]|nr:HEAT repeat domain-containing protein [Kofleriaceae bacterium]